MTVMPSPSPNPRVMRLLELTDRLSDRLGLSVPQLVDVAVLRQLPPGTLGRSLADHLAAAGLEPFITGPRRKQLHDGVHVLTGYGTDPLGEAEVQAFLLGCSGRLLHVFLGAGLLRLIRRHQLAARPVVRSRLQQAFQRGRQAHFNPDTWQPETEWTLPLLVVRQKYGLV